MDRQPDPVAIRPLSHFAFGIIIGFTWPRSVFNKKGRYIMSSIPPPHPDGVLIELLAKRKRSNRKANLMKIHQICREHFEAGNYNFTIPCIGRIAEAARVIKGRALYNAPSEDYRHLINAWAAHAALCKVDKPTTTTRNTWLLLIEDTAVRSIAQAIVVERDHLKAQLNMLKSSTRVIIDRRLHLDTTPDNLASQTPHPRDLSD